MLSFNCAQCGAEITVPDGYRQPFVKCRACGSHEKIPLPSGEGPKYRILDESQRARIELGGKENSDEIPVIVEAPESETPKKASGPTIAAPVIARKKTSAGWPSKQPDFRTEKKPIDAKRFLIDAIGKEGLDMVFQQVAGYLTETDEGRKRAKKARVIQNLMKARVTGEMASQAVEYAEKSPETREILWNNYKSSMLLGFGIFATGLVISLLVHFIAHPGWGFFIFQIPFAVGFAYAVNAAINMAGLKYEPLRSELVHYVFMTVATLLIAAYVIWGIYF
jgi:hypothetical protein